MEVYVDPATGLMIYDLLSMMEHVHAYVYSRTVFK